VPVAGVSDPAGHPAVKARHAATAARPLSGTGRRGVMKTAVIVAAVPAAVVVAAVGLVLLPFIVLV